MTKKTWKEMKEETEKFYKDAVCIDGKVEMLFKTKAFKITDAVMELNDSKRGTFYIAKVVLK